MKVKKYCVLDGRFVLEEEAKISVTDQGFLYGRGVFTTIRVENGECELLEAHLERLFFQSKALGCFHEVVLPPLINRLIFVNGTEEGVYRLKIIFTPQHSLLTLEEYHPKKEPLHLVLYPFSLETPLAKFKTLSYLDHFLVKEYAIEQGFDEAITLNSQGFLVETGSANLFWIDQEILYLPDPSLPYLQGLFLQAILKEISLKSSEVAKKLDEIPHTASFYCTNALMHLRAVASIGDRRTPRNADYERILTEAVNKILKKESLLF